MENFPFSALSTRPDALLRFIFFKNMPQSLFRVNHTGDIICIGNYFRCCDAAILLISILSVFSLRSIFHISGSMLKMNKMQLSESPCLTPFLILHPSTTPLLTAISTSWLLYKKFNTGTKHSIT